MAMIDFKEVRNRDMPVSVPYNQVQPLLRWVYIWMFVGLGTTALAAVMTVSNEALISLASNSTLVFALFFVEIGIVVGISWGINRISAGVASALFLLYAAINGFVLSLILLVFTSGELAAAFGTTAILFGIMSVVGFTTDIDLTRLGGFLFMALIGLIVAMVVNFFLGSTMLNFIISIIGVIIFTALTAYDTQMLKRMAAHPEMQPGGTMIAKMSIFGALMLYINFINIFIFLLSIMGGGRD
jgi:hypothetical protein